MSSEKKEQDILKLMEMFLIEFEEASQVYKISNQNLETAIKNLLQKHSSQVQLSGCQIYDIDKPQKHQKLVHASTHVQKMREFHRQDRQEQRELTADQLRQRFKTNYLIKKRSTSKRFNKQAQNPTKQRLQNYLNKLITVNFLEENNDVFNEIWNTRKFIAVHCITIPKTINPKEMQEEIKRNFYTQIYCSQKFGAIFNKEFQNIIVDPASEEFNQLRVINHLINPSKDVNCIVILRLHEKTKNIIRAHSLNMISCIKPQSPQSFQKYLVHVRKDINREVQMEICPSIHHNPLSDLQKIKLDIDRKIKAQQETAYKMMQQQIKQIKQTKQMQSKEEEVEVHEKQQKKRKNSQSEDEEIKKMKQQVMKSVQQSLIRQRQQNLKQMKKYTPQEIQNPISFKIRFPNGKQIQLTLPKSETLQYLIDYISWQEEVLGFQNELRRNFVLTQPWSALDFNEMENKTFLELFTQSDGEILIVKQIY